MKAIRVFLFLVLAAASGAAPAQFPENVGIRLD